MTSKVRIILAGPGRRSGRTIEGFFDDSRRDKVCKKDIPPGFSHVYDCRHGDNGDWCTPVTIEKSVAVNHAGTLFLKAPLALVDGCVEISDFSYL